VYNQSLLQNKMNSNNASIYLPVSSVNYFHKRIFYVKSTFPEMLLKLKDKCLLYKDKLS